MRFNKWTAMRICKRCYTSFTPTQTQRKRHETSYCAKCCEELEKIKQNILFYGLCLFAIKPPNKHNIPIAAGITGVPVFCIGIVSDFTTLT
jgi:hypothetical protein